MTGTDTTQPFIYHRSHHIHPWLKKTGTCLLKASNILLYYFVSIKSLLSTTLKEFMDSWNMNNQNQKIEFVDGLDLTVLESFIGPKLLIIDDLCLSQNKDLTNHFIRGSHHLQTTTIYISHSIFLNDDNYRVMSNNCDQYMLIMRNKRNLAQLTRLARQILGSAYIRILEAYDYNRNNQFGFVLLSFHPKVPEELLVLTNFFESCPSVFL